MHNCQIYCTPKSVKKLNPSTNLAPSVLREFIKVSQADWQSGLPLPKLLARINRVAKSMTSGQGEASSPASRAKEVFTERSFRRYQTLGCIDAPEKLGRLASYGFRHFIQALLVRRLLSDKVPSQQIAALLINCGTGELERMLRGGVELMARASDDKRNPESSRYANDKIEVWNRVSLVPGFELHFSSELVAFDPKDRRRLMAQLKEVLIKQGI